MAGGYVRKILDEQKILGVLQSVPIYCDDLLRDQLTKKVVLDLTGNEVFDQGPTLQAQDYLHLGKDKRISYFDLRPEVQTNGRPWLKMHIEVGQQSTTLQSGGKDKELRPIFYLPYQQNGTTRMKLKPAPGYAGDEVRFFATATINGCSVYVEGPAETPKVTHGNAGDFAKFSASAPWDQKSQRIQAKSTFMDQRFAPLRGAQATVVDRPTYMAAAQNDITIARQIFATRMAVPLNDVYENTYNPIGAVVGLKGSTASWKFYLQKNVSFGYKPRQGGYASGFVVIQAVEIWPNGPGQFRQV